MCARAAKKSCRESWEMIHICSPGFQRAYSQLARRLAAGSQGPTCGQEARGGRPLTHSRRELACGLRLVPVLLPWASPHSSTTLFFSSFSSPSSWLFPYIWTQRVFTSRMYVDFWSPLIQLTKRKWKHSIFFFGQFYIYLKLKDIWGVFNKFMEMQVMRKQHAFPKFLHRNSWCFNSDVL